MTRFRQTVLFWVTLGCSLAAGCSQPVLEEGELTVTRSPSECRPVLGLRGEKRLFRFIADFEFGEKVPDSIMTRGSHNTKGWISRKVNTHGGDGPPVGWARFWHVVTIVLVAVGFLLIGAVLTRMVSRDEEEPRLARHIFWSGLLGGLAMLLLSPLAGVQAGSRLVIDNASNKSVEVYVNGTHYTRLGPGQFVRTRIGGREIAFEIKKGGKTVERSRARLDDGLWSLLRRALLGNGWYLYNICGINEYELLTELYGSE